MSDTKGRGAIRYVHLPDQRRVRVDSYFLPLAEISRKVTDKIRFAYCGNSPQPEITVNSAGPATSGTIVLALVPNANGTAVVSVVVRDEA